MMKVETGGVAVPNLDGLTHKDINGLGEEGWELVAAVPMLKGGGGTEAVYFCFERLVGATDPTGEHFDEDVAHGCAGLPRGPLHQAR